MNAKLFAELVQSMEQAGEIMKGTTDIDKAGWISTEETISGETTIIVKI